IISARRSRSGSGPAFPARFLAGSRYAGSIAYTLSDAVIARHASVRTNDSSSTTPGHWRRAVHFPLETRPTRLRSSKLGAKVVGSTAKCLGLTPITWHVIRRDASPSGEGTGAFGCGTGRQSALHRALHAPSARRVRAEARCAGEVGTHLVKRREASGV